MRNMSFSFLTFLLLLTLLWSACTHDKIALPTPATPSTSFGASDTNYIELNPVWDSEQLGINLNNPVDIAMGPDGYLFLADENNNRILVLSRSGEQKTENGLGSLSISHPRGVDVDSKLNVLMVNGSDTLYGWNQYLNHVTIDSVGNSFLGSLPGSEELQTFTLDTLIEMQANGIPLPNIRKIIFEKDAARANAATQKYPMYVAGEQPAAFNGVSAGPFGSGQIFLTDSEQDKILQLALVPDLFIKTTADEIIFHYRTVFLRDVATRGSGAGTVDDPWSLTADEDGFIYFTQFGGNFFVQKLNAADGQSPYVLYQHDLMDLERFKTPYDITLDDAGAIFVLDTGQGRVSKYANSGANAGNNVSLGKKGLATAVFEDARGILVNENIVYVVEGGLNRIRRFQYSVSDSDLPDDDKGP